MIRLKDNFNDIVRNSGFGIEQLDFDRLDLNEKIAALSNTINYIYEFIYLEILPNHKLYVPDNKELKTINNIFLRIYCQIKSLSRLNEITDFQCMSFIARSILELYTDMLLIKNKLIDNYLGKYYSFQKIKLLVIER